MKVCFKLILILVSLFASQLSKSQGCSYNVVNGFNCAITVDVTWYDNTSGCPTLCDTNTGVSIPANQTRNFTCSGCGAVCDMDIKLVDINSTLINQSVTSGSPTNSGTFSPGCNGITTWQMTFNVGQTNVSP
jgi:hypothetical protein